MSLYASSQFELLFRASVISSSVIRTLKQYSFLNASISLTIFIFNIIGLL